MSRRQKYLENAVAFETKGIEIIEDGSKGIRRI